MVRWASKSVWVTVVVLPLVVLAQTIHFGDVSPDSWYASAVQSLLADGYLDTSQERFRPGDSASRAEFVKLTTMINGGILEETPETPSFSDIDPDDWFYAAIEEAAREGWVRGEGNCFGQKECPARPHSSITRAEASALIRRAFGKVPLGLAPEFPDNPRDRWFFDVVQALADHCILRGDMETGLVRPNDPLNRAEMVVMLLRVDSGGRYPNC